MIVSGLFSRKLFHFHIFHKSNHYCIRCEKYFFVLNKWPPIWRSEKKEVFFFKYFDVISTANAAFLNGKSVQRNDISKRKTALGDIKNYAPMTPGIGCDKKSSNHLNENQMNLFGDVGIMKNSWEIPSDICSSEPVDYERMWAERLQLSDEEVNCILSKGFYEDDERDLLPPPPSPHDMESM